MCGHYLPKTKEMIRNILRTGVKFENKEEIILRDYLALERTKLANERTLMSYIRASLYLLLGGIAFMQLEGFDRIKWIGHISLGLSIILMIIGIYRFFLLKKRLKRFYESDKINR